VPESPPTSTTEPPKTEEKPKVEEPAQPQVSEELKKELSKAKTSWWKKALYWTIGIIVAVGAFAAGLIGLLYILKGKGPMTGAKEAIQKSRAEIAKSDLEEKIKVAEAKNAEAAVVEKLKKIKEMDDEDKRLEELNKLL
jgi:hypothetical protein